MTISPAQTKDPKITLVHAFRSAQQSVVYTRKNGKPCIFQNHEFTTNDETDVAELQAEIEAKNPYLTYLGQKEKDTRTPEEILNSIVEAEVAKRLAAINHTNDMGSYEAPQIKPMGSDAISDAAAGGGNKSAAELMAKISAVKKVS